MDARLTQFLNELRERFKDETLLRIYTGKEANDAYNENLVTDGCGIFDEEYEDTCLLACSDMAGDGKEYLDGGFDIYIDEKTNDFIGVPLPGPCAEEFIPKGKEAIIKDLIKFTKNVIKQ